MKLTEAQLKAIIAEEVQTAIEEGLFGAIGGAARGLAGVAGKAAGAVGRAAGAVGDKAYGALNRGISAIERGNEAFGKAAAAGLDKLGKAGGEVLDAAAMGSLKADVAKTVKVATNTTRELAGYASRAQGNKQFADLLTAFAAQLAELSKEARAATREARSTSKFAREKGPVANVQEEIAESIVRRITQESKRRR
jgi:hypothetical protein